MSEEVSPEIIQSTQKLLGKHVTKPQLTEKLLKKPPFRFLHDVINAVIKDSSFLKGLYTEAELNSDNVKDRDAKIAFLSKLITAVKTISGKELQARPSKIIAGLDAAETNRLLQTIAKLIDDKVDTKEYVKNFKKSTKDSKDLPSARNASNVVKKTTSKTSISSKTSDKLDSSRVPKKTIPEKKPLRKNSQEISPKVKDSLTPKIKTDALKKKEKLSSKSSKDSSKTSQSKITTSKTISGKDAKTTKKKLSPKDSGSTVSTPKTPNTPVTPVAVVDDSTKESPKEKESPRDLIQEDEKVEVKEDSPRDESWRPQVIDEDRQKEIENLEIVEPVAGPSTEVDNTLPTYDEVEMPPVSVARQPSARPKSARPRSGNNDQRPPTSQNQMKVEKEKEKEKPPSGGIRQQEVKGPVMPVRDFSLKSASKQKEAEKENIVESSPVDIKTEDSKKPAPTFRPKSSMLRPPSVRPSSARPGAPRLRPESSLPMKEIIPLGKINVIVENFDAKNDSKDEEDEEETVVIETMQEDVPEMKFAEKNLNLDIPADKGHLVEQILEQMQDGGQVDKAQLEWEHEGSRGKDATAKEINALRASIQSLTRTANPLGKLTSYLHEDVEAMHSELETWLNMKRQYSVEIAKQKRVNNESNQPLLKQLQNLEENIKKEREEIANVKYNILKNEERIRQLISKQIALE